MADFGSATKVTSKRFNTSNERRGTETYRAPEVIHPGYFNNKADLFAVGCIIFEIVTGNNLFKSDWEISEYARKKDSILSNRWPVAPIESRLHRLGDLCTELLSIEPQFRPGASQTFERLQNIRNGIVTSTSMPEEMFPPNDNAVGTAAKLHPNATIQPAYRLFNSRATYLTPKTGLHRESMMDLDTKAPASPLSQSSSPCRRSVLLPSSENVIAASGNDFPPSHSRQCESARPDQISIRTPVIPAASASFLSPGAVAIFAGGEDGFTSSWLEAVGVTSWITP